MARQYDEDGDPIDPDSGARFGWGSLADVRPLHADGTPVNTAGVAKIRKYLQISDEPAGADDEEATPGSRFLEDGSGMKVL